LCALAIAVPAAQGERVTIRRAVAPNQTLHVRIMSEWDFDQRAPNTPGSPPLPAIRKIHRDTRAAYTLVTDTYKEGEGYKGHITFDEAVVEIGADGQPTTPEQSLELMMVIGKPMNATYDAQGRLQDLDMPFDLSAGPFAVKSLFTSGAFTADAILQRWPPEFSLAVGGSIEIPSEVTLPLPGSPAVPGGRRLKLVSIEQSGQDRIAKMQQTFEGELSGAMTGQGVSFSAAGSGTIDWNLNRGFASAYDINFTLDASNPSAPTLHHAVHTRMTAAN